MLPRIVFLFAALFAAVLPAAEKMKVYQLDAGLYVVQGAGIVQVELVKPDGPVVPPIIPDDELSASAKAIKAAAEKATADPNQLATSWKLATTYREVSRKITAGTITGQETIALWVKMSTDMILGDATAKAAWQPMRDAFSLLWAREINKGGKEAEFAKLLTESAAGLEAVGPRPQEQQMESSRDHWLQAGMALLDELEDLPQAISWAEILKIVMMIIEMLSTLF